jgi:hypothetical protein
MRQAQDWPLPSPDEKKQPRIGGLPCVVELFEAQRPKEPAVGTEIDAT